METKKGNNVYQMVTDRVIEQMKKGIIPWQRPWNGTADGAINYVTRKPCCSGAMASGSPSSS